MVFATSVFRQLTASNSEGYNKNRAKLSCKGGFCFLVKSAEFKVVFHSQLSVNPASQAFLPCGSA